MILSILLCTVMAAPTAVESLPQPVRHEHSFELLSNSRYWVHSGFTDSLPPAVLANVLWAMARAPRLGERELYVARRDNVWRYDATARVLRLHKAGDQRYNSGSAFEVGVAARRHEDAGMAVQAGLLAGSAFRDASGGTVVGGPLQWAAEHANEEWDVAEPVLSVVVFGRAAARPLARAGVARSSDTSLSAPQTDGRESYEKLLGELAPDSVFGPGTLSREVLSQLLWAACGPTPYLAPADNAGSPAAALTGYPQSTRVYTVGPEAVERYHNRLAGTGAAARDHRLQPLAHGDRRVELRGASDRIPQDAPLYAVITVGDTGSQRAMQEAGRGAFQLLAQAHSLGLAGWVTAPLLRAERARIAGALDLPAVDFPAVVFACGERADAAAEQAADEIVQIVRAAPALRRGTLQVDYWIAATGDVRVEVFDMLGRPVRLLRDGTESPGYHSVLWDGTDASGRRLKRGTYLLAIFTRGAVARHKVTLG